MTAGAVPLMVLGGGIAAYNVFRIAKTARNGIKMPTPKSAPKTGEKTMAGTLLRTAVSVGSLVGGIALFSSGGSMLLALPAMALCLRGGLGTLTNASLLYGAGKKALTGPAAPKAIASTAPASAQPKAAAPALIPAPEEKPEASAAPEFKDAAEAAAPADMPAAPKPESRPPLPPQP
jgi:hypothetical protein